MALALSAESYDFVDNDSDRGAADQQTGDAFAVRVTDDENDVSPEATLTITVNDEELVDLLQGLADVIEGDRQHLHFQQLGGPQLVIRRSQEDDESFYCRSGSRYQWRYRDCACGVRCSYINLERNLDPYRRSAPKS